MAFSSGASSGPCARPVSATRSGMYSAAPLRPVAARTAPAIAGRSFAVAVAPPRRPPQSSPCRPRAPAALRGRPERRRRAEDDLDPRPRILGQHEVRQHRGDEGARRASARGPAAARCASQRARPRCSAGARPPSARRRSCCSSKRAGARPRCVGVEGARHLLESQKAVLGARMPEPEQVIGQRLRQIAALAILAHARRAVALGQRRAVTPTMQRDVPIARAPASPAPRESATGAACWSGDPRRAARG